MVGERTKAKNVHSVGVCKGGSWGPLGWYGHLERPGWRMDRGPYRYRWMALLSFPISRWTWRGGDQ